MGHTLCAVKYFPNYAAAFWLPILVFEFFLFALAFRVAWYNHQQLGNWRGATLLHVVLRDNFSFFFVYVQFPLSFFQYLFSSLKEIRAFFAYLVTGIVWLTVGARYFLVAGQLSCAFTTIMSCKFILNLYQAYHKPFRAGSGASHTRSIWATPAVISSIHLANLESRPSRTSTVEQAHQFTEGVEEHKSEDLEQGKG